VDGQGGLDLWNLNENQELPVLRQEVSARAALSRCSWSRNGKQIAVGDAEGRLSVFDVSPEARYFLFSAHFKSSPSDFDPYFFVSQLCEPSADASKNFFELIHKTRAEITSHQHDRTRAPRS
jgi:WD40 repeat protein